jgi:hypothetical protein
MTHVFLASTPLQLLCATEAREHYEVDPSDTFLIVFTTRARDQGLRDVISLCPGWSQVEWIRRATEPPGGRRSSRSRIAQRAHAFRNMRAEAPALAELRRIQTKLTPVETLYVGYYIDGMHQHCVELFSPQKIILLDDGLSSFNVVRRRIQEREGKTPSQLMRRIRHLLTGFSRPVPRRSVEFFTFLDLGIDSRSPDSVVHHRFQKMRERSIQLGTPIFQGPVFLGQPVVELGWASEDAYEALVLDFQRATNAPISYVPHPRENGAMARRLSLRGIAVLPGDKPFEIRVASREIVPTALGGITTTALVTANALAGAPSTFLFVLPNLAPHHEREVAAAIRDIKTQIPGAVMRGSTP